MDAEMASTWVYSMARVRVALTEVLMADLMVDKMESLLELKLAQLKDCC